MEVIVMKVKRKKGGAMVTGVIGASVGPLAGDGLDEAFGLAIGLRAIRSGEAMLEADLGACLGEEFGAVSGAAVGEDALDFDAMSFVEVDGLVESGQDTLGLFIWEEAGEGGAAVVVDGDVEGFDAGAWVALGAVAGGADARFLEASELLDVEVEKVAGGVAFVADDRGFGRFQRGETLEAVAAENAGEGGLGDREDHANLSVGAALAAQGEDLGFELGRSFARLAVGDRRTVVEALGKARVCGAFEPSADGLFADAKSRGGDAAGEPEGGESGDHLCSRQRGERGISVHVVRAGGRWVECSSTTSLPNPFRADNLLKHDT